MNRRGARVLGCRPDFGSCGSKLQRPNALSSHSKNKNDMIDAGGRTINEQQLAELNSELVLARSRTAEAAAKLDRVQAVLQSNSPEATVTATVADTLKNDIITKLRSQYLELLGREADWSVRYGVNHLAVVNLRNQMRELQNSIRNELQRIGETYKSDYKFPSSMKIACKKQLDQAVSHRKSPTEPRSRCANLKAMPRATGPCMIISYNVTWSPCNSSRFRSQKLG